MSHNLEIYKSKALEACMGIFNGEYSRSTGIPLPEIDFILPDSTSYNSGEYYITIGDTWQIHLNFGLLPTDYKDFQEEVKVLTRHEVEHYMCCPFDVITHMRMVKAILQTYYKYYSSLNINIIELSSVIGNHVSDIIVDTKNFYRFPDETVKSEIAWIKKGDFTNFRDIPRHSKLLFLMKEAVWNVSLDINEKDAALLKLVNSLAEKFLEGGITATNLFIEKTIQYTHLFFSIFSEDRKEQQKRNSQQGSGKNDYSGNQSSLQIIPTKESQTQGSQFIFESPEKIIDAINQLAQESSLSDFIQVLQASNIKLDEKEKEMIWFKAQNSEVIPISDSVPIGSNDNYSYPATWRIGDQIEDLDFVLSFSVSPKLIPGLSTKKWVKNPVFNYGIDKKNADLLLVLDYSGSMKTITDPAHNLHHVVIAAFGIIKYFEKKYSKIALITFSDQVVESLLWSDDYDMIRKKLLTNGRGGTQFPISRIEQVISQKKSKLVTVVITDGEIRNLDYTISFFINYLSQNNKLYLFVQDNKSNIDKYNSLISHGAIVKKAITAEDIRDSVLNDIAFI